jgi:hypothetical protein
MFYCLFDFERALIHACRCWYRECETDSRNTGTTFGCHKTVCLLLSSISIYFSISIKERADSMGSDGFCHSFLTLQEIFNWDGWDHLFDGILHTPVLNWLSHDEFLLYINCLPFVFRYRSCTAEHYWKQKARINCKTTGFSFWKR